MGSVEERRNRGEWWWMRDLVAERIGGRKD
jgi:hypothetical protein